MTMRYRAVAVFVATLVLLLTSCGAGEQQLVDVADQEPGQTGTETVPDDVATQRPQEPSDVGGSLRVLNQLGDGEQVVVSRASTDDASRALAVVYDDADGAPGRPLGHAEVPAAQEGSPFTVTLDEPITDPGSHPLWVVMHIDADPLGIFDPGVDEVITIDGDTLRDDFTYTVTS